MERLVASLWSEALGTDDISIHDNFFDIGGHSLLSMQVINRLEKELAIRLPRRIIRDTLEQIGTTCEHLVAVRPPEAVDAEPGTRS
jgi:acyl carrier protein